MNALPVPKPITVISRMTVSPYVLSMLDEMARRYGVTRDDYLVLAALSWASYENSGGPPRSGRDAKDLAREVVARVERKFLEREGFAGWGS